MRAVILDGADGTSGLVQEMAGAVERRLGAVGASTRHFILSDLSIGHCLGEFDCWVKTPGRCRVHDEGQEIERAVHDAEILILLTTLSFGGYGSQLKKAVDRLIPLITPFFEKRNDLTHHQHRYDRMPRFVGIGWDATPLPHREALFRALVESNALNFTSPGWGAAVLGNDRNAWDTAITKILSTSAAPGNASDSPEGATHFLHEMMAADSVQQRFATAPKVAILVASARAQGTSTSESLAHYLEHQLHASGAEVKSVSATAFARDKATSERAASQLAEADILVVAAPLYVDSLPYLGVLALEQVRNARLGGAGQRPARLVAIMNCGFPEPEQLRFAIAVLREFAREAGYVFAGALPVGGGEAIRGRALESVGGMTHDLRHAIDVAAAALASGEVIPEATSAAAARMFLPGPLFRLAGWWGWRSRAKAHGLRLGDLRGRPFDEISDGEWKHMAASGRVHAWPLRVVEKIPECADVVTIIFDDPARHVVSFEAGQYLTVELPIGGDRVRRAYSLSGAPCDGQLSITIKRVPGGLASNWIHDHLAVGSLVRTFGPSGTFTPGQRLPDSPRRLLLIAGGSGIVPLATITREVLHSDPEAEIVLIYGSAALDRAIFAAPLRHLAEVHGPRFSLRFVFETPPPDWAGVSGRLDPENLDGCLPNIDLAGFQQAMLCGPDGMRVAARQALKTRGFPADRIIEESFTSPRRASVPDVTQLATLSGADGQLAVQVKGGMTLLEAALDAGVSISFSCCSGGCGACRIQVTDHAENVVLDEPNDVSAEEHSRGNVPACLVRLRGPVTFMVP
jgi:ferredoxin-NADP reductase/NAD(P)H-dependent FMN reductase